MFFSHSKPANSTFSHNKPANQTDTQTQHVNLLALFCVEMANRRSNQQKQHPSPLTMDGSGGSEFGAAYQQMFYDSERPGLGDVAGS
jgi:hypothetical protein